MSKTKAPRKSISFKEEFKEEYEYICKMEEKYGNLSRFICLMIREHMSQSKDN